MFRWLAASGNIQPLEMARTFNCGIGMVMITARANAGAVSKVLADNGEKVFTIGAVEDNRSTERVALQGIDSVWPC